MKYAARIFEIQIRLYVSNSLKEKRRVKNKIFDSLANNFSLSIIEIGDHDVWNLLSFAFSFLSINEHQADQKGAKIIRYLENLTQSEGEIFSLEEYC